MMTAVGLTLVELVGVILGVLALVGIIIAVCAFQLKRKGKLNIDGVMETCDLCYMACCSFCVAKQSGKPRKSRRKKKKKSQHKNPMSVDGDAASLQETL